MPAMLVNPPVTPSDHFAVVATGIFTILGGVIGSVLTYVFTKRLNRTQWLAENKKVEYQQLLSAIHEGFFETLAHRKTQSYLVDEKRDRELILARTKAARTIADRILVASEMVKMNMMNRWTTAEKAFFDTGDILTFEGELDKLSAELRKAAIQEINDL
jgi:hypothetical protein